MFIHPIILTEKSPAVLQVLTQYAYTNNQKIAHFSNYGRHPRPAHRGDQGGEREGGEPGGE